MKAAPRIFAHYHKIYNFCPIFIKLGGNDHLRTQQVETEFNQKSLMKKTGPTKISSPGLSLGQGQTKMTKKSGCCPEARDGRSQIALQMA